MVDIARQYGIDVPAFDPPQLRAMVQVVEDDHYTFQNFLSKFDTLRLFYRSPEVIGRVTREAVADAAADNVKYMELRFTPAALSKVRGFPLAEVMDWVIHSAQNAEAEYGVTTRLIASINRHEGVKLAEKVVKLAVDRLGNGIVGLDLAGNEAGFSAKPFTGMFREAKKAGLRLTLHAGEWGGAENVQEAIEMFDAERVGHGVRVLEDPHTVALAKERGTTFEVCPTSNFQSGVVTRLEDHPLPKMLAAGLNVTINTDDPGISDIDLSDEYQVACEALTLTVQELQQTIVGAARAAFRNHGENVRLVESLHTLFSGMQEGA